MYKVCKAGFTRQPVPSSLTLQDGSTTTSEKETANSLLHKFFPDGWTAQDSGKQRNITAIVKTFVVSAGFCTFFFIEPYIMSVRAV
jgi:hypothetical protein